MPTKPKLTIDVFTPDNGGVTSSTAKTTNYRTWLGRNRDLPPGTTVIIHTPSGGTIQFIRRSEPAPNWQLIRQTFA